MANRQRLLIVGAGGFGREVVNWAKDWCSARNDIDIAGFLDDNPRALDGFPCEYGVIGGVSDFEFSPNDRAVVAICDPHTKAKLVGQLADRVAFATVVHPTAVIGAGCEIGSGTIVCPHVVLTTNIVVGEHVHLNLKATIGHDARVGSFSTLNSHSDVTGFAVLEEGVFFGSHASVLPHGRVGAYARVGAQSLVLRYVRPGETVMGVPARRV